MDCEKTRIANFSHRTLKAAELRLGLPHREEERDIDPPQDTEMGDTQPTQSTQEYDDPRRHAFYHGGLSEADVIGTLCLLHPSSPAAQRVLEGAFYRTPQHCIQTPRTWQPANTMFEQGESDVKADIALRFHHQTVQPAMGFTFGRNMHMCDFALDRAGDDHKRISNVHFRIFVNPHGVMMVQDMSTNGTFVDGIHLKGKHSGMPSTRMITDGSTIQVPSVIVDETIVFTVKVPNREPWNDAWAENLQAYTRLMHGAQVSLAHLHPQNNKFGMHWNGGIDYNVVGYIGKGAFATVYQIADKSDGMLYAAKELEKRRFMKDGRIDSRLDNELQIMRSISHPNVVAFVDWHEEQNFLYIIMELVPGGDLQGYLTKHGSLAEHYAQAMARQLLHALVYLHKKRITHRDIKPDNILIASMNPFTVKLSDFGLSKIVKHNETFLKTFCGTLLYCAPEVFPHYEEHTSQQPRPKRRRGEHGPAKFHMYSHSVDVWSFAAVLWNSLCGSPPFQGVHDKTGFGMFQRIMKTELDTTPLKVQGISADAIDLLLGMLRTDPAKRFTEIDCLRHPWLYTGEEDLPDYDYASDLGSIAEEDEESVHSGAEQQLSQLSLIGESEDELDETPTNGRPAQRVRTDDEREDEELDGLDDEELDWMIGADGPAIRSDTFRPRGQARSAERILSSSVEQSEEETEEVNATIRRSSRGKTRGRLFGEISSGALQSSGTLAKGTSSALPIGSANSHHTNGASVPGTQQSHRQGEERAPSRRSSQAHHRATASDATTEYSNASLLGAESMVRDLNMESPASNLSPHTSGTASNPQDPITPQNTQRSRVSNNTSTGGSQRPSQEATPRAAQQYRFDRTISLPAPSSSPYDDPTETTAHNPPQAAQILGNEDPSDHLANKSQTDGGNDATPRSPTEREQVVNKPSIPPTEHPSFRQSVDSSNQSVSPPLEPLIPHVIPEAIARHPPKLGILISTTDSIAPLFLQLNGRLETWGRNRKCSIVYPNANDIRIPKLAIALTPHVAGLDKPENAKKKWSEFSDLQMALRTQSSAGILVNGVKLASKSADGKKDLFGHVYSGDVITVYEGHDQQGQRESLKFVCRFYHGLAKNPRPAEGPAFDVMEIRAKDG